jgi:S-adenosylmethionine:tRNA ribosyltransferase-isomerase
VEVPHYELPDEAIAQTPVEPRDAARLLDAIDETVTHRTVADLPQLLQPGDVVVVNDSRVIPARLGLAKESGGRAEVLLLDPLGDDEWTALVRPGRRLPPGTLLLAGPAAEPVLEVGERIDDDGVRRVRFLVDAEKVMATAGSMALPPYIHAPLESPGRYQTLYAKEPGSVAAPTAGLHISEAVLAGIGAAGATLARVDLAVGLGTFRPVSSERAEDHVMHTERFRVPPETWEACRSARRVVAIGTTTVRALETAGVTGRLEGASDLFIRPGFHFRVVDVLLTNFHLPRSSLLLMLEAFCGPRWRDLYAVALSCGYRFLSFGDAMIVSRA